MVSRDLHKDVTNFLVILETTFLPVLWCSSLLPRLPLQLQPQQARLQRQPHPGLPMVQIPSREEMKRLFFQVEKLSYLLFKQLIYSDLKKYEFKFVKFKWWFLMIFVKIKND
jgi:hypothetical protein